MHKNNSDVVAVLDFGGQYAHLIASRVRRLGVFCRVLPPDVFTGREGFAGVVLSGGPQSVSDALAQQMKPRLEAFTGPVLGICFGHQLLAKVFGGRLAHGVDRQYGPAGVVCDAASPLFRGLAQQQVVWMSHGDHVAEVPPGWRVIARAEDCPVAGMASADERMCSVQFHPEVAHTPDGTAMLENFLARCTVEQRWHAADLKEQIIAQTREAAGDAMLFLLISGGVDSLVALQVCLDAVGPERVRSLHVDTGLMRLGESDEIISFLKDAGFSNIELARVEPVFLQALKGVVEPEQKRAIIGRLFVEVLRAKLREMNLGENWKLVQGTIYPDRIESGGSEHAAVIKTHHNRVPEIQAMIDSGLVVEPLQDLYKDEVRELGRALGLPARLLNRHPFPGPGLGIRALCSDGTAEPVPAGAEAALAAALAPSGLAGRILPVKSVGVQGDERTYRHPAVIWRRPGADWPDWPALVDCAARLLNTIPAINRVVLAMAPLAEDALMLQPTGMTREGLDLLRRVDDVVQRRLADVPAVWQAPVVSLPLFDAAGGQAFVMRPVCSTDAMTADVYAMPLDAMAAVTAVVEEMPGVSCLFYDITTKPPGTIEWE